MNKEQLVDIPKNVLKIMSERLGDSSQKNKLDEYEEITVVKYYLLNELNRIFGYTEPLGGIDSGYCRNRYQDSSNVIAYICYDKKLTVVENPKKCTGMYIRTKFSRSVDYLHKTVRQMLGNLKRHGYLLKYEVLHYTPEELKYAKKKGWELGTETRHGYIKGVRLFSIFSKR